MHMRPACGVVPLGALWKAGQDPRTDVATAAVIPIALGSRPVGTIQCERRSLRAVTMVATVSRVERSHHTLRRRCERILERGSGAAIAQHGRGVPHKDAARVRQSLRGFLKLK